MKIDPPRGRPRQDQPKRIRARAHSSQGISTRAGVRDDRRLDHGTARLVDLACTAWLRQRGLLAA